jgi:hypothetical protein
MNPLYDAFEAFMKTQDPSFIFDDEVFEDFISFGYISVTKRVTLEVPPELVKAREAYIAEGNAAFQRDQLVRAMMCVRNMDIKTQEKLMQFMTEDGTHHG